MGCYVRWTSVSALVDRLAGCFADYRNLNAVEHSVSALVAQRVYGLALGYKDLAWPGCSSHRGQCTAP